MGTILKGIRDSNPLISVTTFNSISSSFPSMHIADVIEICKIAMGSRYTTSSALLILAESYANASDIVREVIEPSLIHGIKVYANVRTPSLSVLLKKTDLNDAMMIKLIEIYANDGLITPLVDLLKRTNLSDTVRKAIELSLITGIDVCAKNRRFGNLVDLLGADGMSDTVMLKAIKAYAKGGVMNFLVDLLERTDLSDTVRKAAIKETPWYRRAWYQVKHI